MPDPLSLSDRLALQRTRLANERTFLTYVRTSLAMVGFGLVLLQLHPTRAGWLGYAALLTAAVVMVVGFLRFQQRRREIEFC
jgi:putative membrane protein